MRHLPFLAHAQPSGFAPPGPRSAPSVLLPAAVQPPDACCWGLELPLPCAESPGARVVPRAPGEVCCSTLVLSPLYSCVPFPLLLVLLSISRIFPCRFKKKDQVQPRIAETCVSRSSAETKQHRLGGLHGRTGLSCFPEVGKAEVQLGAGSGSWPAGGHLSAVSSLSTDSKLRGVAAARGMDPPRDPHPSLCPPGLRVSTQPVVASVGLEEASSPLSASCPSRLSTLPPSRATAESHSG